MTDTLEGRIRRLEDRLAIDDLIALYGITTDDRDEEGLRALFTAEATVDSTDGVMNANGVDAIMEQFAGRWVVLGPSNHFTHDRVIRFDDVDPDRATGLVLSHAEMSRKGEARIAAIRYLDEYRRGADGRWRFASRRISWFYYCDPAELGETLCETLRIKAYAEPIAAGWPESLPTWQRYYAERGSSVDGTAKP